MKKAKQYIKNGDIYQINLSREFEFDKVKNPYNLFLKYYKAQPVEYGAFFDFHDHALVSGSMELFLEKKWKPYNNTTNKRYCTIRIQR